MAEGILPNGALQRPTTQVVLPNADKTYALDVNTGRIQGYCEGADSLVQAIYKILSTPQSLLIYSEYGCSVQDLINADKAYLQSELKRRITLALKRDARVLRVSDFTFSYEGSAVDVRFWVQSNLGMVEIDRRWSLA